MFNLGGVSLIYYIIAVCEKALKQFPSSQFYRERKAAEKKAMEEKIVEKRAALKEEEDRRGESCGRRIIGVMERMLGRGIDEYLHL